MELKKSGLGNPKTTQQRRVLTRGNVALASLVGVLAGGALAIGAHVTAPPAHRLRVTTTDMTTNKTTVDYTYADQQLDGKHQLEFFAGMGLMLVTGIGGGMLGDRLRAREARERDGVQ